MDSQLTPHAFRGQILGNNSNYLTNSELLSLRWSMLLQKIKVQFAINCQLISLVPHPHGYGLITVIQLSTAKIVLIIVNSYLLFDYQYFQNLINLLELILYCLIS